MKWPWIVSGNRHRRLLRKYRALKKDYDSLRDPVEALARALPDPASAEAEALTDSTGRVLLTASAMKAVFRKETQQPRGA